jgi:hypothetical protein
MVGDARARCGSGQYKRAKGEWATRGALATCQPRMASSNDRWLYAFERRIATCSHITASDNLVRERWGAYCREVLRLGWVNPLVEFLDRVIRIRAPFRSGGPYPRHPKEMPLQSRAMDVARQLHTVCRQAHALKRMLSKVVRLGHSHLLETPTLKNCTASRVLSVAYATEKYGENDGTFRYRAQRQLP